MKTELTTIAKTANSLSTMKDLLDLPLMDASVARSSLAKGGAVSVNLTDEEASIAWRVTSAMRQSEASIATVCKAMGAFRLAETWRDALDDNGAHFKSENAFLKALFPAFSTSTLSIYADVGATVYIPAMRGEYADMPGLAEMSPTAAKYLLSALKDEGKRKALPAALKEATKGGTLSTSSVKAAVKAVSGGDKRKTGDRAGELTDAKAGSVADALKGGAVTATVRSLIQWDLNGDGNGDGDLCGLVLERNRKDFMAMLKRGIEKPAEGAAILSAMLESIKAAK